MDDIKKLHNELKKQMQDLIQEGIFSKIVPLG